MPYYEAPCWFTLDSASLLVTSHFNEGMVRAGAPSGRLITLCTLAATRMLAIELLANTLGLRHGMIEELG